MKMREVADIAGVSSATVSRVLNGSGTVQPEYRERVLRTIEELGYRPNRLASNLRRQKVATVGVVVSDIENPHFAQMVRAVEDDAYNRGYRVLLCNTDETARKQSSYLDVLADERVLGVILSPSDPGGTEISRLLDLDIPVVAFDRRVEDARADAVVVDNAAGTRAATEHLLARGHRRIGFVGGPTNVETGAERLEGYEARMREADLEPHYVDGGFRIDRAEEVAGTLLDAESPTALVVANNLMTIGALRALRSRRLKVPDDVALVAFDDPFWAELVEPPLTTLAQPIREMARRAVELLFDRIEDRHRAATKEVFRLDLKIRGSCGPIPKKTSPPPDNLSQPGA